MDRPHQATPVFRISDLPDTPFEALPPGATWEDLVRRAKALRGPSEEEDRVVLTRKLGLLSAAEPKAVVRKRTLPRSK